MSTRPSRRTLLGEHEQLGGTLGRREYPGHCLKGHDFLGRGVRIEIDGERLDQGRTVGAGKGLQPRMGVAQAPAFEPHANGSIEPAGDGGQIFEKGFGKEEAFAVGGDGAEPHFSTLVAAVKHGTPTISSRAMVVPIQDPEELFFERVNYKR